MLLSIAELGIIALSEGELIKTVAMHCMAINVLRNITCSSNCLEVCKIYLPKKKKNAYNDLLYFFIAHISSSQSSLEKANMNEVKRQKSS